MLFLYCTSKYIIAQDNSSRVVFEKTHLDDLKKITKRGVEIALDNPYRTINCMTLEIEESNFISKQK